LLINGLVLKASKSSICSPVPINITGLFVAATLKYSIKINNFKINFTYALKAPPPLA